MSSVENLISQHFKVVDHELHVEGVGITKMASVVQTPLFVYSKNVIEQKLQQLRNAFPQEFSVYYSVKANPNQTILKYFLSQGVGLEIASAGEYQQSVAAGCSSSRGVSRT